MRAARLPLVFDPYPHSGGDPLENGIHVLENILGLDPHDTDADRFETLVAALGKRVVLILFVDHDRHAEIVAVEVHDRAADHGKALEGVAPEIRIGEALGERLVRRRSKAPHLARLIVQRIEALFADLPAAALLGKVGRFGIRSVAQVEGFATCVLFFLHDEFLRVVVCWCAINNFSAVRRDDLARI